MINILVPMAGKSVYFVGSEYTSPKPLLEIGEHIMIQHVVDYLKSIQSEHRFIFVVNEDDCKKYYLDDVLKLVTDNKSIIVKQSGNTKGAVGSCLLAIDYIENDTPLIISNSDQVIKHPIKNIIQYFNQKRADAGVVGFTSVHPKWSYALEDDAQSSQVIEVAEKRPISKNAIAGFYYFRQGIDFVNAAKRMIKKEASVNELFFIAPTLNEMILENSNVLLYKISNDEYHSFYNPNKMKEYIQLVTKRN